MDNLYVAGVGMTAFGLMPDRSIKSMVADAVGQALDDAGAAAGRVGAAVFANVGQGILEGQATTPGQMALRPLGFEAVPITNVENACASASTAFYIAATQILAGQADIALAVGVEKLSTEDTAARDRIFNGAMDVHDRQAVMAGLARMAEGIEAPAVSGHRSVFMDIYGYWARAHMRDFGSTQRQLAAIASKNHRHAGMNPLCQFQKQFTVDEVLAGRALSYPLTVPMCSPYSDGAAAAVLCSRAGLDALKQANDPVRVHAIAQCAGVNRDPRDWDRHITRIAADQAYRQAGLTPAQMTLAEVHDATAFGELLNTENLRLCERADGGPAAERGETELGGRVPVNVSGGLESRGHPIGATGLAQIHELTLQLRGQAGARQVADPRYAIAENGGGLYGVEEATAVVSILGRMH